MSLEAGAPNPAQAEAIRWRGSLASALIRRVALLVAVTAIVLDIAAVVVARQVWLNGLDSDVQAAARNPPAVSAAGQSGPYTSEVYLQVTRGMVMRAFAFSRDQVATLNQEQINGLLSTKADGRVRSVFLADLGMYRVISQVSPAGQWVVGVSMRTVQAAVGSLIILEFILTVTAVIAAAVVAAAVVRRTLRPLTILAGTASRVAAMRLDQGEVQLGRLSGPATNPESEVGRVGLAFNHMLDNVEDALVARHRSEAKVRAFVADASHELRNPLAAIRGYAELMSRDHTLPEQTAVAVNRIDVESRRMSKLVEEMLMLARLDEGTPVTSRPVDIGELLVNAVSDASVAGPDHHWKFDVPDEPLTVMGDENQLHEVVANLLGNARKHTPADTHILASAKRVGQQVVLSVADDGPGVPDALQRHIFERFVRADQARTHDDEGSTGLGLSIVSAVVEAHGGTVTCESVPGATKFTVSLPQAPAG
ncbi:MAG: HAMP domain-containing histidine kinase [Propionibacteriaceae bacterium]|nr:HAMP domain-containing histidine kinase [Propionibacteriaceae bacterium]